MANKEDKEKEKSGPTGKISNVGLGGNIFNDSFFDALDDGLGQPNFSKLGEDTKDSISDIISDDSLNLAPKPKPKQTKKLTSRTLPASSLPAKPQIKEKPMTEKKIDPLLRDDDPTTKQLNEIWKHMNTTDASEYKLMTLRLEPQVIKGTKINGYLETFHLPTTIPDIIEQVGQKYGGGKFQIRIVDGAGKYVKSKTFEISGMPKIAHLEPEKAEVVAPVEEPKVEIPTPSAPTSSSSRSDDIEDEDWPDDDYYPRPRTRSRAFGGNSFGSPYASPYSGGGSFQQRNKPDVSKDDLDRISRDMEDKLDSKLDKMSDMVQMMMSPKKKDSFLNADVVKALAPVVVTWLDGKSTRDSSSTNQFSEMNKQVVGLMEGMQNLVRMGDKTKEDFAEKERKAREEFAERERREREATRKEVLEHQRRMEEKFLEERRRSEERHQAMLIQMKDSLESKHHVAIEGSNQSRLQHEKMRAEFREKEERNRIETRQREEQLREEARKRDEESRRREMEFWQKQRTDEMKWRAEMQLKEDEARGRENQWREENRQREIDKERELKLRELEMMKTIQEMNNQKSGMQQKFVEQVYSNNNNNRESQLQMEMAIARMTSDNEARMMQANAEMQLEKIRHATQMQMTKMKTDLSTLETKKDDDPIDTAMQDYLKRRLQMDMVKELNMEMTDDEVSGGGILGVAKKLLSDGAGPMLLQMLLGGGGGGGGGMQPGLMNPAAAAQPRVVAPNPTPTPRPVTPTRNPAPQANIHDLDDYEEEDDDLEEEIEDVEITEEEDLIPPDVDLYKEIPRVADFFKYLKEAIEAGSITPEQAAEEANARLSPEIVLFLTQIKDSRIVVQQLYPLLTNIGGDEFVQFFVTEEVTAYMDKMLVAMSGEILEEEPTIATPVTVPVPTPTPAPTPTPTPKAKKPRKPRAKKKVAGAKVEAKVETKTEAKEKPTKTKRTKNKTPTS